MLREKRTRSAASWITGATRLLLPCGSGLPLWTKTGSNAAIPWGLQSRSGGPGIVMHPRAFNPAGSEALSGWSRRDRHTGCFSAEPTCNARLSGVGSSSESMSDILRLAQSDVYRTPSRSMLGCSPFSPQSAQVGQHRSQSQSQRPREIGAASTLTNLRDNS